MLASFGLAFLWLALLIYAIARFGKRGLLLLLGAPPVLFVILLSLEIIWNCAI